MARGRDHDCLHTNELPAGNRTTDEQIIELADSDERVLVTTDRDFRDSHLLRGTPRRPWLISTGNITNDELHTLVGRITTSWSTPSTKWPLSSWK